MKPQISYLSAKEIGRLHRAALAILERVGIKMPFAPAREMLAGAGAKVGQGDIVRLPAELVEKAVQTAPGRGEVVLYGATPEHDVVLDGSEPHLVCMTMATAVIDPQSGQKRPATSQDLARLTRLADALENVSVNGGLITPQEVPGAVNDWHTWSGTLKNTTKHITGGVLGERGVREAVEMAGIVRGCRGSFKEFPTISGWTLSLPPLGFDADSLASLMEMARQGMPAMVSSGPILGTTSPVTLAGTIAQAHAEILASLVLHQLTRPGAPFIYTSFARGMDMKTGSISMACPEFAILKICLAQMGGLLNLPLRMPSMLRDSKILDAQAGFETGMVAALSGLRTDLMDGMQLDMDLVVDYADPVFCNEAMSAIKRLAKPVEIDEAALALEVIERVGPGGSFLTDKHTFANFRAQLWQPELFERGNWQSWQKQGGQDIRAKALDRAKLILSENTDICVSAAKAAGLDEIVRRAETDLKV